MAKSATSESPVKKYLVVDDHAGFRKFLRDILVKRGGEVVECADGADALAVFEREHPDCVLMDVEMPGLDGLAATRAIHAVHPEARVVIVTQHDSPALREASLVAGARAVQSKDDLSGLADILDNLPRGPVEVSPKCSRK